MTRLELLRIVVGRARSNGFEFRRWYVTRLGEPWINAELSLQNLEQHCRYYALLFSHDFACTFWKPGEDISFRVDSQTFQRVNRDGTVVTVVRKPFTRRSTRRDAWRFHLRQMALAEEPLRYIRRYLHVEETPDGDAWENTGKQNAKAARMAGPNGKPHPSGAAAKMKAGPKHGVMRPLPTGPPAFLLRPYGGRAPDSGPA